MKNELLLEDWCKVFENTARKFDPKLPDSEESIARYIAPSIIEISKGLTKERKLSGTQYLNQIPTTIAYLLYYVPITFYKAQAIFEVLWNACLHISKPINITDIGAGQGTMLWGILHGLSKKERTFNNICKLINYNGIDFSDQALQILKDISLNIEHNYSSLIPCKWNVTTSRSNIKTDSSFLFKEPQTIICLSNVFNELESSSKNISELLIWMRSLWDNIEDGGFLVLIEPAHSENARNIVTLRNAFSLFNSATIVSPCTHQEACPLTSSNSLKKQWCHQEIRWKRPKIISIVDQITGLNKSTLSFSHLVVQKLARTHNDVSVHRALSPALQANGTLTVHLCGPSGFESATLLTRHLSEANKEWENIERGDEIQISKTHRKNNEIRLSQDSLVLRKPLFHEK